MARDFAKKFYASKQWKKTRQVYIESVHGLCEDCLDDGKINTGYIVHHKTTLTPDNINDPYITLHFDNLRYLCLVCHNKTHGHGECKVTRDDVMFNEYGELVKVEDYL